ncbi:hypothetical protein B296_00014962 [Ensete ventricosum]|uniref:Uncharacterized protein n=1 Tax=Ensete ventricosum TaxID=4639 RepID=A0A427AFG7_ENSVE|nr:hypothetical protein B296_00014962 [Ensete ventricosum]
MRAYENRIRYRGSKAANYPAWPAYATEKLQHNSMPPNPSDICHGTYSIVDLSLIEHGDTDADRNAYDPHGDGDNLKHRNRGVKSHRPSCSPRRSGGREERTVFWSRSSARTRGYETGRRRLTGSLLERESLGWRGEERKEERRVEAAGATAMESSMESERIRRGNRSGLRRRLGFVAFGIEKWIRATCFR